MAKNVTAPRRWRSSPDSPPTQLAYVTQPEIDLLVDANIHGSMKGKPNRGPKGIMSLDGDYVMSWSRPEPSRPEPSGPGPSGPHDYGGQPSQVPAPVVPAPVIDRPDPTGGGDPEKADYFDPNYINPQTGKTVAQMQAEATAAAKAAEIERMKQMNLALKTQQLHGGPTGNINKWTDQELMQAQEAGLFSGEASGMLGGVTGYEKEVNKLKKAISSHMGKKYTQGINPQKELSSLPEYKALAKLTGDPTLAAVTSLGVKDAVKYGVIDLKNPEVKKTVENYLSQTAEGYDMGYDPTGRYNFAEDIEGRYNPKTKEWEQTTLGKVHDKFLSGNLTPNEIRQYAHFLDYGTSDPNQNQGGYGYRNRYGRYGPRGAHESKMALLQALAAGSPIKQLEKSGFHHQGMEDPYAEETRIAGEKGIFSGLFGNPGQVGVSGEGMKRLVKSWGSGYTNPRYANVAARGGIMSAWNNMRR